MKYLKWFFVLFVSILLISILISCVGGKSNGPEVLAMRNTVSRLKASMKDPESMLIRSSYTLKKLMNQEVLKYLFVALLMDEMVLVVTPEEFYLHREACLLV